MLAVLSSQCLGYVSECNKVLELYSRMLSQILGQINEVHYRVISAMDKNKGKVEYKQEARQYRGRQGKRCRLEY